MHVTMTVSTSPSTNNTSTSNPLFIRKYTLFYPLSFLYIIIVIFILSKCPNFWCVAAMLLSLHHNEFLMWMKPDSNRNFYVIMIIHSDLAAKHVFQHAAPSNGNRNFQLYANINFKNLFIRRTQITRSELEQRKPKIFCYPRAIISSMCFMFAVIFTFIFITTNYYHSVTKYFISDPFFPTNHIFDIVVT